MNIISIPLAGLNTDYHYPSKIIEIPVEVIKEVLNRNNENLFIMNKRECNFLTDFSIQFMWQDANNCFPVYVIFIIF